MIAAFDVHYHDAATATVAAVVFESFDSEAPAAEYRKQVGQVAAYLPGSFYLRELPCILDLLGEIDESIDTIIIDCYVQLGDRPGLGAHLRGAVGGGTRIIGVAKSRFAGAAGVEVVRGTSAKPLVITAVGVALEEAAEAIRCMRGAHRIPTLLKAADALSRAELAGARGSKGRKPRATTRNSRA